MSYTAVHIPEFPVVAWQRKQPGLRKSACAVVYGVAPQEKVVSLCERAKAVGVVHGMSKVQTETSGMVSFRTRDIAEEQAAFGSVLEIAERFSPRVEAIASPEDGYADDRMMSVRLLIDSSRHRHALRLS